MRAACSISASTSSSPRSSAPSCCCWSSISTTSARNPAEILVLARSGGVFYGGLIGATLVAFWYIRRHDSPLDDVRHVRARHRAGSRHRTAWLPGGRLLLRRADERRRGASRSPIHLPPLTSARR